MWHKRNDLGLTRVLLSPSRKCRNAVERNHNKRQGREVFRRLKEYVKPGFDIAFVFFPGDYSYQERYQQISDLLKKALLCDLPVLN